MRFYNRLKSLFSALWSHHLLKSLFSALAVWVLIFLPLHLLMEWPLMPVTWYATVGAFLFGYFYTHWFEYYYHRWPMHTEPRGNGILSRIHQDIRDAHNDHHRAFPSSQLTKRSEELPDEFEKYDGTITTISDMVAQRWWVYPVLLMMHYAGLALLLSPSFAMTWAIGSLIHYWLYEISHWYTHITPNWLDPILAKIPIVRTIRRLDILIHKIHHTRVDSNFNFVAPYFFDRLFRTFLRRWKLRT